MKAISAAAMGELAADIEIELARLSQLEQEIYRVQGKIAPPRNQRDAGGWGSRHHRAWVCWGCRVRSGERYLRSNF